MENRFATCFENAANLTHTENGATTYRTNVIENPLVRSFYTASQYRNKNAINRNEPLDHFRIALDNDDLREYCIRYAFMIRDIEQGMGERALGRDLFLALFENVAVSERLVNLIVDRLVNQKYGRWDDIIYIAENCNDDFVRHILFNRIVTQFKHDITTTDGDVSLLGKWMPSINAGKAARRSALRWAKVLKMSHQQYRLTLANLRKQIDIVEARITANQYDKIEYAHVPSLAMLKHINTFRHHDEARFAQYMSNVAQGVEKINTSVSTAAEIIHAFRNDDCAKDAIEVLWNNHLNESDLHTCGSIIPVCDVSGSMDYSIGKMTCMDVSIGLSLYAAQCNTGAFHNKIISFSAASNIIQLEDNMSLGEKISMIRRNEGFNTDVERVLANVLEIAKVGNCRHDEIPTLVFFSDMEFDEAIGYNTPMGAIESLFDHWVHVYNDAGFDFPKVVFWNINNRSGSVPMRTNSAGMILVSGYSEQMLRTVFSGRCDPWEALKETLDNERYSIV